MNTYAVFFRLPPYIDGVPDDTHRLALFEVDSKGAFLLDSFTASPKHFQAVQNGAYIQALVAQMSPDALAVWDAVINPRPYRLSELGVYGTDMVYHDGKWVPVVSRDTNEGLDIQPEDETDLGNDYARDCVHFDMGR